MDSSSEFPQKQCTDCEGFFPATLQYFHAYKRSKDGLRNLCKECRSKRDKQYRQNNHEVYLENERRYREAHRERTREADRRYRQSVRGRLHNRERQRRYRQNPLVREQQRQASRVHYWANHEKSLASLKRYRETHREFMRQLSREYGRAHPEKFRVYLKAHPEKRRVYEANRRARKRATPGIHTSQQIQEQYQRQKKLCYYCQKRIEWGKHHVDHTFPLTRAGARNDISHLVITCRTCNLRKGNKYPWEWPDGGRLL